MPTCCRGPDIAGGKLPWNKFMMKLMIDVIWSSTDKAEFNHKINVLATE